MENNNLITDEDYIREAMRLAALAEEIDEVPVGALAVKDGKIIAAAYNTRESSKCATHHAEILAIEQACRALGGWRLPGVTLYVTMEPCAMCAGAIINARIPRVVYVKNLKFEKITDESEVKAGDIIFVGNSQNIPVPEYLKDYPRHVFICAGHASRNNFYRYDAGSDKRLQSTQPSVEPLSTSGSEFRFAYRPVD